MLSVDEAFNHCSWKAVGLMRLKVLKIQIYVPLTGIESNMDRDSCKNPKALENSLRLGTLFTPELEGCTDWGRK